MKQLILEIPEWIDEETVILNLRRMIELEQTRRDFIERVLERLKLDERDVKEFNEFRERLWKEKEKEFLSL